MSFLFWALTASAGESYRISANVVHRYFSACQAMPLGTCGEKRVRIREVFLNSKKSNHQHDTRGGVDRTSQSADQVFHACQIGHQAADLGLQLGPFRVQQRRPPCMRTHVIVAHVAAAVKSSAHESSCRNKRQPPQGRCIETYLRDAAASDTTSAVRFDVRSAMRSWSHLRSRAEAASADTSDASETAASLPSKSGIVVGSENMEGEVREPRESRERER